MSAQDEHPDSANPPGAGEADRHRRDLTGDAGRSPAPEEDFAAMLEESLRSGPSQRKSFDVGQSVEGVIVALEPDVAFIDIGGKGEATMSLEELRDPEGKRELRVGDRVKATVVSTGAELRLSRKLEMGAAAREQLAAAFRAGLPVEGRVEKSNKGGYEVKVAGLRAFCPMSQIDTVRDTPPEQHIGRVYTFRITELREGGRNLVVSRRALLEEEEREKAREILRKVVPGAVLSGRVASLTGYGAFVDLGAGVQGLLHVSEMGWTRVSSPAEVLQPDQEITVQILKVEDEGRKISLSLKQLQADPWTGIAERYHAGQMVQGRVTRLADFGAFVELEPGVEALAHVSTFPPVKGDWKATVPPGTAGTFRIESVDAEARRIGVALRDISTGEPAGEARKDAPAPSSGKPGDSGKDEAFGSMADKLRAALQRDENKS